ncbi:TatD family hydrolase [Rhodospirillaceae bacterium SYSU D60014]|uniref:TatD family hydrolase n=1 Tax=Virgifigura deserti TaxID=2268457 RepID=UPI000E669655
MLVDSHCHLNFKDFNDDLDVVVSRAEGEGVGTLVTICTRLNEFEQVLGIAERYDNVYCSVGVHPHEAENAGDVDAARLIGLAAHPKVVGIGETGLDYYYDNSPRDQQQAVFRAHMKAARETGLPLIVHTRDADEDMAALLTEGTDGGRLTGVLHCFSSGRELAEKALELGFYISLSGIVTFKNAEALREIARDVPADRLLVETDSPYLAPMPHRGKRNEPAFVVHTAARVAELRGVTVDELARTTTANFFRLFGKAHAPASGAPGG